MRGGGSSIFESTKKDNRPPWTDSFKRPDLVSVRR